MQLMKPPARSIHIFRSFRVIKSEELSSKSPSMFWLNTCLRSKSEKSLNTFMSKAFYHQVEVYSTAIQAVKTILRALPNRSAVRLRRSRNTGTSSVPEPKPDRSVTLRFPEAAVPQTKRNRVVARIERAPLSVQCGDGRASPTALQCGRAKLGLCPSMCGTLPFR